MKQGRFLLNLKQNILVAFITLFTVNALADTVGKVGNGVKKK